MFEEGVTVGAVGERQIKNLGVFESLLHPRNDTDRQAYAKVMANLPYGRMGTPEEIANLAVFFASDAMSKYISGDVISVDAGTRFRQ